MTNRMLDLAPVGHCKQLILPIGELEAIRAGHEDSAAIRRGNRELRLEQPGPVTVLVGLGLFVAQEQGHRPLATEATHDRLDPHVWRLRIRRSNHPAAWNKLELERPAARHPLPDPPLAIGVVHPVIASP